MATGRALAVALAAAFSLGGAVAAFWLLGTTAAIEAPRPVFAEVPWPFPTDQWGKGKAFRCGRADCGAEVTLYLRAKIGFCNCESGVADDSELDRMSDFYLVGGAVAPLGSGQPVEIGRMKGRSRAYALDARDAPGRSAISVAFNDRCDMAVATVLLPHDRPAAIEPGVIAFLNSPPALRWVEVTLGL
jgi:hypothetical protein